MSLRTDIEQSEIPLPKSLRDAAHERVVKLSQVLGISLPHSIGIVEALRLFSIDYAKRGTIGKYSNEAIADSIFYTADSDQLIAALEQVGWITPDPQCRYRLIRLSWKKEDVKSRRRDRIRVAGGEVSRQLREEIYARDGHKCVTCDSPDDLTIDHKEPVALGGKTVYENLQTLCRPCNSRKRDRVEVTAA